MAMHAQPMNRPTRTDCQGPKRTSRARSTSPLARPAARAAVPRTSSVTRLPAAGPRVRRVWTPDAQPATVSPPGYRGRITRHGSGLQRHDSHVVADWTRPVHVALGGDGAVMPLQ